MTERVNLDNDTDILSDPIIGALPESDKLELNRQLDARFAAADKAHADEMRAQAKKLNADRDDQLKLAERGRVSSVLEAHIASIPDDGVVNLKARASLQELRMSALTGTDEDKDGAWHLERAAELVRLHQEGLAAAGGDGSQKLPDTLIAAPNGSPIYNLDRMMLSVYESVQEHGAAFDLDKLSGSPEAEMTKDYAATPFAKVALAELNREARPGQRIVPIPSACLRPDIVRLAETYAGAVTANQEAREPTFRRDQLIDHFRPISRLEFLGVMMETIANDQSLPRVTGAHAAGWKTETANADQGAITLSTPTTEPHRLTVYDDVSWQRLAAADSQFGIIPVVSSEMMRASNSAKEKAVYQGTGTNPEPRGIYATTGVLAGVIGGAAGNTTPTYGEILAMITDIADGDIPVEMLRWITTWGAGAALAQVLTFATGSSVHAVPLWQSVGAAETGQIGAGFGTIANYPAAMTTQLPTNRNSGAETANDEHGIIAGVWPYVTCFDYAMAFLTIDDISLARSGQTRLTINSYHDVLCRVPTAFSAGEFNP